jgi:hypothetical protein
VHKRRILVFSFLMLFGLIALMNSIENPRLSPMHVVDRLQLIASGLCFGMACGVLVGGCKFPGE